MNKEIEFQITNRYSNDDKDCKIYNRQTPLWRARLASALIEKWGMVAAIPDGEDSSGRSKLRLQTPEELVERACQTADLLVTTIEEKEWVALLPGIEEINNYKNEEK